MVFGEHLGEPPAYSDYFNAGMRLVDNVLRNNLNNLLGNPSASLSGLDQSGSARLCGRPRGHARAESRQ